MPIMDGIEACEKIHEYFSEYEKINSGDVSIAKVSQSLKSSVVPENPASGKTSA